MTANFTFPVICFFRDRIQLARGNIADSILNNALALGVSISAAEPFPTQFIPFDINSSLEEVASAVVASIVQKAVGGEPHFQVEDVLNEAVPIWSRFHTAERRQLVTACVRVIDRLRKATDFRHILRPAGTASVPHLYTVTLRIPTKDGERVVHPETLRNWATTFMTSIAGQPQPPRTPVADEGTQLEVPWSESSE